MPALRQPTETISVRRLRQAGMGLPSANRARDLGPVRHGGDRVSLYAAAIGQLTVGRLGVVAVAAIGAGRVNLGEERAHALDQDLDGFADLLFARARHDVHLAKRAFDYGETFLAGLARQLEDLYRRPLDQLSRLFDRHAEDVCHASPMRRIRRRRKDAALGTRARL